MPGQCWACPTSSLAFYSSTPGASPKNSPSHRTPKEGGGGEAIKGQVLIPKYTPRHVGKCIYCGSADNLTDEHIVPRGLGGPWRLLKASCKECAEITSGFERDVVGEFFILVRTKLGLPTYHPKKRPDSFSFMVTIDGREEVMNLPVSDCPTLFMMPQFEKPGYIRKDTQGKGISVTGMSLHGSGLGELKTKHNVESISYTEDLRTSFARVLAKIAYGMTVFQYGLDMIEEAYVLPCILGKKDDVGQWVGCEDPHKSPDLLPRERFLHRIDLLMKKSEVGARIRLFANYQTPEYLVIVGRLKGN